MRQQQFFRAGEILWNYGTSINIRQKHKKNKSPARKHFGLFSPRYCYNYILIKNLTLKWTQTGSFFIKITFFDFQKRAGRASPLPSCMPVSVAEYVSISLNIPEYPWKLSKPVLTMPGLWICVIILHVWQTFWIYSKYGFWVWHGCICKGYKDHHMAHMPQ